MTQILVIALCLALNAIFSAVEMAFVTTGKPELRNRVKRGDLKAKRLLSLRENPERALSVIQVGITLVGAISAAVGGAGAEEKLAPIIEQSFGLREQAAEFIAVTLIVLPLTYMSVVLGELVPKTIALRYPAQVLNFGSSMLVFGSRFLGPVLNVFEGSTRFIIRLVLPKLPVENPDAHSTELDLAGLTTHQRQYILNLANIETKRVRDALLPWSQVDSITSSTDLSAVLHTVVQSGHTRIPVVDNGALTGILHSKEFLAFVAAGSQDWQSILRPAIIIKPTDELLSVLRKLQEQKRHMAIVIDKNVLTGILTLEDIMEEVVGEIYDEDDDGLVKKMLSLRAGSTPRRL